MQKLPTNLATIGFLLLFLDILIGWILIPHFINSQISNQIKLKNGTDIWGNWVEIPIPVYLSFYIFNVTNPVEVRGGAKPVLQQLGPYVYREQRTKIDISVSEDENIVTYRQPTYYFFEENMSTGREDDNVTFINVPFVVVTHMAEKAPSWLNYLIHLYVTSFEEELFIHRSVAELLFEGYHQPLMADIESVTGRKLLHNKKFGLYYPKNGSDDGIYQINTGVNEPSKFGEIVSWNKKTKLDWWVQTPGDYCNMINGTDGTIFPPFITKERILMLFNPELCRSLHLTFDHDVEFSGIPGYRFTAPSSMLQDPHVNKDNICFCPEPGNNFEGCTKTGALSLSSCKEGVPITMSAPHFYESSLIYLNQSIGLCPSKEFHQTFVDIEPTIGVTLKAHRRIQMNIELNKRPLFDQLENVPDMLFPLLWVDEFAELDDVNVEQIKGNLLTPVYIITVAKWGILGLSQILISLSIGLGMVRLRRKSYHI